MIFYDLNFIILTSWRATHAGGGTAMQALSGLTLEEIAAVQAADDAEFQRWSAIPAPLVRPRPGLLPALHANRRAAIMGFVAASLGPYDPRTLCPLLQEANRLLLTRWCQAARARENIDRFELDEADIHALARRNPERLQAWTTLPFAIAVPKRRLIGALQRRTPLHLLPFVSSWEHARDHPPTATPPASRGPQGPTRRAARQSTKPSSSNSIRGTTNGSGHPTAAR